MIQEWLTMWRQEFAGYSKTTFQKDLLASITVAAVALPLALAFGVASGADAAAGLVTAVLAGLIIGVLGGSPHPISGPTGAMSAVLIVLATRYGLEGIWVAGALAGIMLVALGVFRLGRVVALIPSPVITGFTSGIAIIIAFGQIDNFLGIQAPPAENVLEKTAYYLEHGVTPNWQATAVALLVMFTMILWPRFKFGQRIPGSLVGIILATLVVLLTGWNVPIIGAIPRTILLENRLKWGNIPWEELPNLVIPAMSIAALGAIESLLCGAVAGNMTGVRRGIIWNWWRRGWAISSSPFLVVYRQRPPSPVLASTSKAAVSPGWYPFCTASRYSSLPYHWQTSSGRCQWPPSPGYCSSPPGE
jgi:SulP family sulfate permease